MSTSRVSALNGGNNGPEKTYFEQQREMLVTDIAQVRLVPCYINSKHRLTLYQQSLELVLQNINKLNRSIEEVTSVGNEFAPVESLWSHFENVMAKDPAEGQEVGPQEGATEHEGETEVTEVQK